MTNNAFWNAKNPHQGEFPRVLCVCSAGLLRSPTLAWVLSNEPFNYNTRAAGTEDYALVRMSEELIHWADHIYFVNQENYENARRRFPQIDSRIVTVLSIPDNYDYRDPKLVEIMREQLKLEGTLFPPVNRYEEAIRAEKATSWRADDSFIPAMKTN